MKLQGLGDLNRREPAAQSLNRWFKRLNRRFKAAAGGGAGGAPSGCAASICAETTVNFKFSRE